MLGMNETNVVVLTWATVALEIAQSHHSLPLPSLLLMVSDAAPAAADAKLVANEFGIVCQV